MGVEVHFMRTDTGSFRLPPVPSTKPAPTRAERIAHLKAQISAGTYAVDGHAVARAMLRVARQRVQVC